MKSIVAPVTLLTTLVFIIALTAFLLHSICKGQYKIYLRYKRREPEILASDSFVKVQLSALLFAEVLEAAHLGLALSLRVRDAHPKEDYLAGAEILSFAMLWVCSAFELRQWIRLSVRLRSANTLRGLTVHLETLQKWMEMLAVFISLFCLILFMGTVFAVRDPTPEEGLELVLVTGITVVICCVPLTLIYAMIGYNLWE